MCLKNNNKTLSFNLWKIQKTFMGFMVLAFFLILFHHLYAALISYMDGFSAIFVEMGEIQGQYVFREWLFIQTSHVFEIIKPRICFHCICDFVKENMESSGNCWSSMIWAWNYNLFSLFNVIYIYLMPLSSQPYGLSACSLS